MMRKEIQMSLLALLMLCAPAISMAQMNIDDVEAAAESSVRFKDSVKRSTVNSPEYFSKARYRAERAAIRQERNKLEIIASLQGSLTSYNDPWVKTSGGDNTTAILSSFTLNHSFKKERFTLTSRIVGNLGVNQVKIDVAQDDGTTESEGVWFKNQDAFSISVAPTMAISPVWSYGTTVGFRTQFANGYVSRSQQNRYELKSGFMAPGYLDVSGGMTYKSPNKKLPFIIAISPLALSATYVSNDIVKDNFGFNFKPHPANTEVPYFEAYGVNPYESSKYEGGSSIQIDFDRTFEKLNNIRYTTRLHSFYGWMTQTTYSNIVNDYDEYVAKLEEWSVDKKGTKPMLGIQPTVRWENTISIPATDVLSTTIKFQLYYNRAQTREVQTQTYLSVGLSYTYKNK